MLKVLRVILKKSLIGSTKRQKATIAGLGLKGINSVSVLKDSHEIRGMIKKVSHLVKVEEGKE